MIGQRPDPGSEEAVKQGCICSKEQPYKPNWTMFDPKCPVHGGVENLLAMMEKPAKGRKGAQ